MRVEFRQGVPKGCARWLRENVGLGNIEEDSNGIIKRQSTIDMPEFDWFYDSIYMKNDDIGKPWYVSTITVKDPKLATMFILRWS
jgi:hypothetical protein